MANKRRPKPTPPAPRKEESGTGSPFARLWRKAPKAPEKDTEESGDKTAKKKDGRRDGTRETIESVVVAFILAFLFRTFEAEAFVIPTGSMAPTLYGRHKDVVCPECGTHYTIGASVEVTRDASYLVGRVQTGYCPNCRYALPVRDLPVFTGDRILVNKWPYEFGNPQRWDVVVFKYPGGPRTNYIKRLVGLPGEELRIEGGNVFVREPDSDQLRILRKDDPTKQRELQIPVYDDEHPPSRLLAAGWPERWAARRPRDDGSWADLDEGDTTWVADREARTYSVDVADGETAWLAYRHLVPRQVDWDRVPDSPEPGANVFEADPPQPSLVTDFLTYNAYRVQAPFAAVFDNTPSDPLDRDAFWVDDLTLSGEVVVEEARGELLLELPAGFRRYRCAIDLATGEASLYFLEDLGGEEPVRTNVAVGKTPFGSTGRYRIAFANVDRRLLLWVRNRVVEFDAPTTFNPPNLSGPTVADLTPAAIAVTGAAVRVGRLVLERDVYYRADRVFDEEVDESDTAAVLAPLRNDPDEWTRKRDKSPAVTFAPLGDDEFFMMGDNSAQSQDSRLWTSLNPHRNRHAVPRSALVGKAFFVYWPHGVPFLNDGKGYAPDKPPLLKRFFYHHTGPGEVSDYPSRSIPFYPQYDRMTRIR